MAEVKFEEALKKLEKIVQDLERGELTLDEALKKYQEGVELSRLCSQRLDQAKKKVDLLAKNKKGDFELTSAEDATKGE
jgi:exodeoxyribonuclease VII small subunit